MGVVSFLHYFINFELKSSFTPRPTVLPGESGVQTNAQRGVDQVIETHHLPSSALPPMSFIISGVDKIDFDVVTAQAQPEKKELFN